MFTGGRIAAPVTAAPVTAAPPIEHPVTEGAPDHG
jgi:hypothetical protein